MSTSPVNRWDIRIEYDYHGKEDPRSISPDPNGDWIKHEDVAHVLNMHDELVAALQRTLETATDYIWEAGLHPSFILADARDTLAKAKGEKPNVP